MKVGPNHQKEKFLVKPVLEEMLENFGLRVLPTCRCFEEVADELEVDTGGELIVLLVDHRNDFLQLRGKVFARNDLHVFNEHLDVLFNGIVESKL